jgi:hypothetical protein
MSQALALLLAMMEPATADEDEFHEWYDLEHVPERQALDGFLSARRFVCIDGWPRYLALYDLRDLAVLGTPAYRAVSGEGFSPWSRRSLARVRGRYSVAGEQLFPGGAVIGAAGPCARLLLLRFRDLAAEEAAALPERLRAAFASQPGLRQLRLFRAEAASTVDHIVAVEIAGPALPWEAAALGPALDRLDIVNTYVPYWRAEARRIATGRS